MALIVETGTRPPGANSYVSVADADAYFTARNIPEWAGSNAVKEQALIAACRALELQYGPKYASAIPPDSNQALLFPRHPFYDRYGRIRRANTIPPELKNAQCELALLALRGKDLFPAESTERFVRSKSVTVGDISTSVNYSGPPSSMNYLEGFNEIERILWPILKREDHGTIRLGL